jgi:hypothetical protein
MFPLQAALGLGALVVSAGLAGCGRGGQPDVAPVTGTVTLDSLPLQGAMVEFSPESGKASRAVTDQQGRYDLIYLRDIRGAVLGRHRVRIITDHEGAEAQTRQIRLPARYDQATELTAEVGPRSNTFDFALESR